MPSLANRPVLRRAAELAVEAARDAVAGTRRGAPRQMTGPERVAAVNAAAARLAADPVVVNETNSEPLPQSRTFVAALAVLLTSAGMLATQLAAEGGFDWEIGGPAIGTLLASVAGLVGRVKAGLRPIDWRRPWTIFGLGR